jgi:peptidoglycan pentaglycine glycine transferase (the first glycine)
VTIRTGDAADLELAYRMLRTTARRGGFDARSRRYYREELESFAAGDRLRLLVASYEGEPLAVNVSAVFGARAAYLHGASIDHHRELMPNHLLMWEGMRWAKDRGCTSFDLWGIPDEAGRLGSQQQDVPVAETTDGLWGVFRFKRGFGGEFAYYAAAHDFVYSKSIYGLMHRVMVAKAAPEQAGVRGESRVHDRV